MVVVGRAVVLSFGPYVTPVFGGITLTVVSENIIKQISFKYIH